jgi:mannose/fructose/N-acetylgalactosamine-specific phosphotransferase system component IIB
LQRQRVDAGLTWATGRLTQTYRHKEQDQMEIALARIDDRLIHGQVVTAWLGAIGQCNEIIVCDDKAAKDTLIQNVIAMTKPPNISVRVLSVEGTIQDFKDKAEDSRRVMLITRGASAMLQLLEGGVEFDYLNLGGSGAGPGRTRYKKNISLTDEELATLREIEAKGVKIEIKMVPTDQPVSL